MLTLLVTLQQTTPPVWRRIDLAATTLLSDLADVLLVALHWGDEFSPVFATDDGPLTPEDEAYGDTVLADLLAEPGQEISFGLDSDDDFHVTLELLARSEARPGQPLPYVAAGAHTPPPDAGDAGGLSRYNYLTAALADPAHPDHTAAMAEVAEGYDPLAFDAAATNEELRELFHEPADAPELGLTVGGTAEAAAGTDLDAAGSPELQLAWLERTHGIRVVDGDVRGTPPAVLAARDRVAEMDPADPKAQLRVLLPLAKRYPDDPLLLLETMGLYGELGQAGRSRHLLHRLITLHADFPIFRIRMIDGDPDDDSFARAVAALPQPLAIHDLPAGTDGAYGLEEFVLFEHLAIRAAVLTNDADDALDRFDRLVRLGLAHGDLADAAYLIARDLPLADPALASRTAGLHPRSQRMLEIGQVEVRSGA